MNAPRFALFSALLVACALSACESGCKHESPLKPIESPKPPPLVTVALADGGTAVVLSSPPFVTPLTRHPALAKARDLALAKEWILAGEALEALLASSPFPADLDRSAVVYLEGRHFERAKDPRAVPAFDRVDRASVFFPDAQFRAATALLEEQKFDLALEHLGRVALPPVYATEERQLRAQALFGARRFDDAKTALQSLDKDGKLRGSPELTYELAGTLLETCPAACEDQAKESDLLSLHLTITFPKFAEKRNVASLRDRAAGKLQRPVPPLTDAERLEEIQDWVAADAVRGRVAAEDFFQAQIAKKGEPAFVCKVATVRAQSLPKKKSAAAWDDAIKSCAGSSDLPSALYNGAKAGGSVKGEARALELYERLEKEFPTHRLADDARFLRGLRILEKDPDEGVRLLSNLPDDFPEGDMRGEALFRAALAKMTIGDWSSAAPLLEKMKGVSTTPLAKNQAEYFLARAREERGERETAAADYERIIRGAPLSYYMALAYARLASLDKALGERIFRETVRGEPKLPLLLMLPVSWDATLARPLKLLEIGDFDRARAELRDFSREEAPLDQQLSASALYMSAGAFDLGHQLVRSRLKEHASHYPSEGRYRFLWSLQYPDAFRPLVESESTRSGIPTSLAWGIMREESTFVVEAKSPADAFGLMQLIVPTACGVASGTPFPCPPGTLKNPEAMETILRRADVSITLGTKLLGGLRKRFPTNPALAIPSYNAGAGAVERWVRERGQLPFDLFVESIPYDETRNYTKHVLASELAFAELYEPNRPSEVLALPLKTQP